MHDKSESIEFGRFRVFPSRRELLVDGKPVRLGGRAFDLLIVLIETPGTVVSKDDLLTRVWPDRVVAESSLQTQILSLRQAFGADRDLIRTVAGRGYQFTGNLQIIPAERKFVIEGSPVATDDVVARPTNLPRPLSELIDPGAEIEEVSNLVRANQPVTPESIEFGRFHAFPGRRELLVDGKPVRLGGRAFDLLMALIGAPGTVVSKDDLLTRVWPDRVVAESSLQTQILSLRHAFGADRDLIRTIAGRGYQFTGDLQILSTEKKFVIEAPPVTTDEVIAPLTNLPQPISELIGRSAEIEEVSNLVRATRLVTLTGTGGIGKTRLAFAVARGLLSQFPDGVWLAELSPLSDPGLVPAAVAAAVGLELGGGQVSAQRVAQTQAARRTLLLLDTCEHVVGAAAMMAEAVLQAGSAVHVIATSREPLRAEGERIYPVPPLAVPAEDVQDLLQCDAVRLFVERARATEPDSISERSRATTLAAICRRLDGIPLAIEMAAARVATLGVEELADRLNDRFRLLTGGRRTALPRHQTLRATLDWSHGLLAESERVLLRRLAVFAGAVDLEAVDAVAASAEITSPEVVDGISSLVAKSLVVAEIDGGTPLYHLLDTTRAYATVKLAESGERERLARRHAEYYRDLFERAEAELEMRPTADWLGDYGRQIDNVRAALGWAFSPNGDVEIGVALTVAAIPLCVHLSLLEECRSSVERALGALAAGAKVDPRREMKLQVALGTSLIWASDATIRALGAAWTTALEIAEELDDAEYQLRSLLGLWFFNRAAGRLRASLAAAERFSALAASHSMSNDRLIGDRLIGLSQHFIGDQPTARHHLEHMLAHYVPPVQKSHIVRFLSTQRGSAGTFLARSLWLQGFPDRARRAAENSVNETRASSHVNSLCYVLADAGCPIALWTGDLDTADRYVATLIDLSTRYSLTRYLAFGRSHRGLLVIERGDIATGLQLLRSGLDELGEVNAVSRFFMFQGPMAEALGRVGRIGQGLSALEEAIARADATEERWSIAELLRVKGELLVWQGEPGAAAMAEDLFRQALDWAGRQDALSWELRAATSLARLLRDQDRPAEAKALLEPVYARFTEGFDTADLRTARATLQDFD